MRSLKSIFCNALPSFLFRPPFYTGRKAEARRIAAEARRSDAAALRTLGEKDVFRLTRIFYADAGRVPPTELPKYNLRNSKACKTGRGPFILTGAGYDCFKNCYVVSEEDVRKLVVPFLIDHPECELQLAFLENRDSLMGAAYHAFLIFETKP